MLACMSGAAVHCTCERVRLRECVLGRAVIVTQPDERNARG